MTLATRPFCVTVQQLRTQRKRQQPTLNAQKQSSRELEEEESAIEAFKAAVSCLTPSPVRSVI